MTGAELVQQLWENGEMDGFEGPEKRLEVDFELAEGSKLTLRSIAREYWDEVVGSVNGVILKELHSAWFDAYLISESSMFVYPHKVVMLTCGTTTLLNALPKLIEAGDKCNLRVEWVQFSRKNFIFPHAQLAPHRNFADETAVLKDKFPEGSPFVLGPLDSDHWFSFIGDYVDRSKGRVESDQLLTIYMHEMDPTVASLFFYGDESGDAEAVTCKAGISTIIPHATIQPHCFDRCGYSVNAMVEGGYFTMHITPEAHCSYASFETNIATPNVLELVKKVLGLFRPKRAQTVLMFDSGSAYGLSSKENKHSAAVQRYTVKHRVQTECEPGYKVVVTNYRRVLDE